MSFGAADRAACAELAAGERGCRMQELHCDTGRALHSRRHLPQVLTTLPDERGFTCAVKSEPRVLHRKERGARRATAGSPKIEAVARMQRRGACTCCIFLGCPLSTLQLRVCAN